MKKNLICFICMLMLLVLPLSGCQNIDETVEGQPQESTAYKSAAPQGSKIPFASLNIRTGGYHSDISYPIVTVVTSEDELNSYYHKYSEYYDFSSKKGSTGSYNIGFIDTMEKYDAGYFSENYLVIVILEEGSGSIEHKVADISEKGEIRIERNIPSAQTCDMAEWNIIIEISNEYMNNEFKVVFENIKID